MNIALLFGAKGQSLKEKLMQYRDNACIDPYLSIDDMISSSRTLNKVYDRIVLRRHALGNTDAEQLANIGKLVEYRKECMNTEFILYCKKDIDTEVATLFQNMFQSPTCTAMCIAQSSARELNAIVSMSVFDINKNYGIPYDTEVEIEESTYAEPEPEPVPEVAQPVKKQGIFSKLFGGNKGSKNSNNLQSVDNIEATQTQMDMENGENIANQTNYENGVNPYETADSTGVYYGEYDNTNFPNETYEEVPETYEDTGELIEDMTIADASLLKKLNPNYQTPSSIDMNRLTVENLENMERNGLTGDSSDSLLANYIINPDEKSIENNGESEYTNFQYEEDNIEGTDFQYGMTNTEETEESEHTEFKYGMNEDAEDSSAETNETTDAMEELEKINDTTLIADEQSENNSDDFFTEENTVEASEADKIQEQGTSSEPEFDFDDFWETSDNEEPNLSLETAESEFDNSNFSQVQPEPSFSDTNSDEENYEQLSSEDVMENTEGIFEESDDTEWDDFNFMSGVTGIVSDNESNFIQSEVQSDIPKSESTDFDYTEDTVQPLDSEIDPQPAETKTEEEVFEPQPAETKFEEEVFEPQPAETKNIDSLEDTQPALSQMEEPVNVLPPLPVADVSLPDMSAFYDISDDADKEPEKKEETPKQLGAITDTVSTQNRGQKEKKGIFGIFRGNKKKSNEEKGIQNNDAVDEVPEFSPAESQYKDTENKNALDSIDFGALESEYMEEVEKGSVREIIKEVKVAPETTYDFIMKGKSHRVILVTGDRRVGTTTFAYNIANFFAKNTQVLYVDCDVERHGLLNYLDIDWFVNFSMQQQQGFKLSTSVQSFYNSVIRYDNNMDILTSLFGTAVSDREFMKVIETVTDISNEYSLVVLDVPLDKLELCSEIIPTSIPIVLIEASKCGVMNFAYSFDKSALEDRIKRKIVTNGFSVFTGEDVNGTTVNKMKSYVGDVIQFDRDDSNWVTMKTFISPSEINEEFMRKMID